MNQDGSHASLIGADPSVDGIIARAHVGIVNELIRESREQMVIVLIGNRTETPFEIR